MAGALSGDVDIPKVGKLPKIAVVIGVGSVVGLILWERHQQSAAASSSGSSVAGATTGDPYPPDGSTGNPADPNSTDPATGMTYGDEAAGYGSGLNPLDSGDLGDYGSGAYGLNGSGSAYPWDGTYGNPNDPYSEDPSTGLTYGDEGGYGTTGTGVAGPPFSTNAQWSQYVLSYWTTNQFPDLPGMTTAIGLYIAGATVTSQQGTYIQESIAVGGTPPVAGPGSFPPSIRTTGTGTTGSPTGGNPPAQSPGVGVTPHSGYADFEWSRITSATGYELLVQGAGGKGTGTSHVDQKQAGTGAQHVVLKAGAYKAQVRATNSAGNGPYSPAKTFTVKG